MRYAYDDEADALYVYLREDAPVAGQEVAPGGQILDLDSDGGVLGIEVVGASVGVRVLELVKPYSLGEFEAHLRPLEGRSFTTVA
jgi:uncharacterized protein YuzE